MDMVILTIMFTFISFFLGVMFGDFNSKNKKEQ